MDRQSIIKALERKNYIGTDVSLDESLFTYGQVSKLFKNDIYIIYSLPINELDNELSEGNIFDYTIISIDDLIADTEEAFQDEGFISFIGISKQDQKNILAEIKAKNIYAINFIIQDLNSYYGKYKDSCYFNMSFKSVLR